MNAIITRPGRDIRTPLELLIQDHGLFRVSMALLRAALRPGRSRPPPVDGLSAYLLRDIGLDPSDHGLRGRDWRGF